MELTDETLARWEADAMETMAHGPHRTRLLALIAEVRRVLPPPVWLVREGWALPSNLEPGTVVRVPIRPEEMP